MLFPNTHRNHMLPSTWNQPPCMNMEVSTVHQWGSAVVTHRSEEHTSELQSLAYLVCRLLLEKKKAREFDARILERGPDFLVLDQTLFYPERGAQRDDTGTLRWNDGRARVPRVTKETGAIKDN